MKVFYYIVISVFVVIVSGCYTNDLGMPTSSIVPGRHTINWRLPPGFHGDENGVVALKFKPQNTIGLDVNSNEKLYLRNYIATKLAGSKRFTVLASGYKGDQSNLYDAVLELTPTVRLVRADTSPTTVLFKIIVAIDCKRVDKQDGIYDPLGTFAVEGVPKVPYVSKVPAGQEHKPDISGMCEASYRAALAEFIRELNRRYPVSGKIFEMAVFGNKVTFQFGRGVIEGVNSSDDILIYAVEKKESGGLRISPAIAIAKAEVSLNQSALTVVAWNTADPEVKNDLMPRIFRGELKDELYAVCRENKK